MTIEEFITEGIKQIIKGVENLRITTINNEITVDFDMACIVKGNRIEVAKSSDKNMEINHIRHQIKIHL